MLQKIFMASFAILALNSGALKAAQTTEWSNATAAGSGCPSGTSVVTITPGGDEIAWTFDAFGFDLTAPASASRFCRLSASAKIAGGYYLGELKQELSYAGIKSQYGSRLSVGAQSRFFGFNLPQVSRDYPNGTPLNSLFETVASVNNFLIFAPPAFFCGPNANRSGLFQATLSANGQVFPNGGSASLSVQGQNVTFKATSGWLACPPS